MNPNALITMLGLAYIASYSIYTAARPGPYKLPPLRTRLTRPRRTMTEPQTTLPTPFDAILQGLSVLLESRIACLGCSAEHHKAITAGKEPTPINLANVIVAGNGQCWQHVQFVDRPLVPGERASGIIVPGMG